jgi:hypothetical protein
MTPSLGFLGAWDLGLCSGRFPQNGDRRRVVQRTTGLGLAVASRLSSKYNEHPFPSHSISRSSSSFIQRGAASSSLQSFSPGVNLESKPGSWWNRK